MIEKGYCGKDTEVMMTKAELECMLAEAEERGYQRGSKQNEKLKAVLRAASAIIEIVNDE